MRYTLLVVVETQGCLVTIRSHVRTRGELVTLFAVAESYVEAGKLVSAEMWDWQERVLLAGAGKGLRG